MLWKENLMSWLLSSSLNFLSKAWASFKSAKLPASSKIFSQEDTVSLSSAISFAIFCAFSLSSQKPGRMDSCSNFIKFSFLSRKSKTVRRPADLLCQFFNVKFIFSFHKAEVPSSNLGGGLKNKRVWFSGKMIASQAIDRGSIPRTRIKYLFNFNLPILPIKSGVVDFYFGGFEKCRPKVGQAFRIGFVIICQRVFFCLRQ